MGKELLTIDIVEQASRKLRNFYRMFVEYRKALEHGNWESLICIKLTQI